MTNKGNITVNEETKKKVHILNLTGLKTFWTSIEFLH